MFQNLLANFTVAVDREEHRERRFGTNVFRRVTLNPVHESGRLFSETDAQKAIDCEGSVADPGVPVIPITRATDDLRNAGSRSRHNGSSRFKGKKFESQSRS